METVEEDVMDEIVGTYSYFSDFVFKIRLIRLAFSFKKKKNKSQESLPLHHRGNSEWEIQKNFQ